MTKRESVIRQPDPYRTTLEFLGTWEMMFNPNFKVVEFDHFKSQAGLPTFTLSAKHWIEKTNAVGLYVQSGRLGGTYAHSNIRDYASINELTVLSNLETHNAELIKENKSKRSRFKTLYEIAKYQTTILDEAEHMKSNRQRPGMIKADETIS